MARKYQAVQVYVNSAELQAVREKAAAAGLSMSEWAKRQLLGEEAMSEEGRGDRPTYEELDKERRIERLGRHYAADAISECDGDKANARRVLLTALLKLEEE